MEICIFKQIYKINLKIKMGNRESNPPEPWQHVIEIEDVEDKLP